MYKLSIVCQWLFFAWAGRSPLHSHMHDQLRLTARLIAVSVLSWWTHVLQWNCPSSTPFSSGVRAPIFHTRPLASSARKYRTRPPSGHEVGIFHKHDASQPACLELRILDLLEALHATLHLLRRRIVSTLRVLVDIQLVVLSFALVRALHHVFSQDLGDGLYMLDGVVGLF